MAYVPGPPSSAVLSGREARDAKKGSDMVRYRRAGVWFVATALACLVNTAFAQPAQIGAPAPEVSGGPWINSDPLTLSGLRGRVVLVEFWTYG
jgi:hypothetical protein